MSDFSWIREAKRRIDAEAENGLKHVFLDADPNASAEEVAKAYCQFDQAVEAGRVRDITHKQF